MPTDQGGNGSGPPRRERPLRARPAPEPEAPRRPVPPKRERPLRAQRAVGPSSPRFDEPPTGPPARPPIPTHAAPPPSRPPDAVTISFEGPGKRSRLTVAFRIILAIPAAIWLSLVGIVAFFAAFVGWVAAIFIGRLPRGIATFLARYVQYNARFYAYAQHLLTDRYPPFSLGAPDGAVNLDTAPGRLNRAAVLFRFILVIPAYILQSLLASGVQIASPVVWLIILISGRMPTTLFEAEAAVLRYQTRFWAYALMLTGEYPGDLLGDTPSAVAAEPPASLPATPRITRLVLSRGARRLVVLFIVLGVVVGLGSFGASALTASRTSGSLGKLRTEDDALFNAKQAFDREAQACAIGGGLDCLHAADVRMADAFARFRENVGHISFPVTTSGAIEDVLADARDIESTLRGMAQKNSASDYEAAHRQFQAELDKFGNDLDFVYSPN